MKQMNLGVYKEDSAEKQIADKAKSLKDIGMPKEMIKEALIRCNTDASVTPDMIAEVVETVYTTAFKEHTEDEEREDEKDDEEEPEQSVQDTTTDDHSTAAEDINMDVIAAYEAQTGTKFDISMIMPAKRETELISIEPKEILWDNWHAPDLKRECIKGQWQNSQDIKNAEESVQYDEELYGKIRWNVLSDMPYTTGKLPWSDKKDDHCREWTEYDYNNLEAYIERKYKFSRLNSIDKALVNVARRYPYNPIMDALNTCYDLWDRQTGHIKKLLPYYLGADDTPYTEACMKLTLLSGIKRVYAPGCKNDITLSLDSGQGVGKSSFVHYLALRPEWTIDKFDAFNDEKKSGEILQRCFIVELAEMSIYKKSDVNTAKAFLTSTQDVYRPAYGKQVVVRPRHCIFISTANNLELIDRTGNRRYMVVKCNKEKQKKHVLEDLEQFRMDVIQAWGEAMFYFLAANKNPQLTFPKELEEEANQLREDYLEEDPWVGTIQNWLDKTQDKRVCALSIWRQALCLTDYPSATQNSKIHSLMKTDITGWHCVGKQKCGDYGFAKCYERDI